MMIAKLANRTGVASASFLIENDRNDRKHMALFCNEDQREQLQDLLVHADVYSQASADVYSQASGKKRTCFRGAWAMRARSASLSISSTAAVVTTPCINHTWLQQ